MNNGIRQINGSMATIPKAKTPNQVTVNALQNLLNTYPNIKHVRFHILDYGNTLRARLMPVSRALQIASQPGTGPNAGSPIQHAAFPTEDVNWDWIQEGMDLWVADWSSLKTCGYAEGHASVMCDVQEPVFLETKEQDARDPRSQLKRIVEQAKTEHDVEFLVGCEIEFILLLDAKAESAISTGSGIWTAQALRSSWFKIVEESVEILEAAGIPVWIYHDEGADGKFEISTSPKTPLAAIDSLIYTHETIKSVAKKHNYHATMHPKAFENGATCGNHIHVSLSKPELGTNFLAGVLENLRALTAVFNPGQDSYQRQIQYGGGWVMWGNHKLNPVRRIEEAYFEFRTPDCLANPYLVLASIIGTGMDGVVKQTPLNKAYNDQVKLEPDAETRKRCGINEALPKNVEEAIAAYRENTTLKEVFGEKLYTRYGDFTEKSLEFSKKKTTKERREALVKHI